MLEMLKFGPPRGFSHARQSALVARRLLQHVGAQPRTLVGLCKPICHRISGTTRWKAMLHFVGSCLYSTPHPPPTHHMLMLCPSDRSRLRSPARLPMGTWKPDFILRKLLVHLYSVNTTGVCFRVPSYP